jgi:hypothetical protein
MSARRALLDQHAVSDDFDCHALGCELWRYREFFRLDCKRPSPASVVWRTNVGTSPVAAAHVATSPVATAPVAMSPVATIPATASTARSTIYYTKAYEETLSLAKALDVCQYFDVKDHLSQRQAFC